MVDPTPNNPTNDTNAPAPQETKPPETLGRLRLLHARAEALTRKLAAVKESIVNEVMLHGADQEAAVDLLKDLVQKQCVGRCGGAECVTDDGRCDGWCSEEGMSVLRVAALDMVNADVWALLDALYDTSQYSHAAIDAIGAEEVE